MQHPAPSHQHNNPYHDATITQQPTYQPVQENPGEGYGLTGVLLASLVPGAAPAGIILGIIGRKKSKQANMSTMTSTASLVVGSIICTFYALIVVFWILVATAVISSPGVQDSWEYEASDSATQSQQRPSET